MPSEQQIQTKIKDWIEKNGGYVVKVVQATKAGVPDLLVCYKGMFIGIEVKRPSTRGNISKLQKHNLNLIQVAEGKAIVAWDLDMVIDFFKDLE